ncbi:CHAT domain-containing protein [Embleya scabrispora]|uniref:CHAT domain-containing protein n=1 Tax=Embleya scabrispora TaxID=159449 RepID=UPI000380777C|nr:CHAT domain-containing protein [Embleya scabrispora]MYS79110.1 CHAT domain-containing protein [Streptomyces sp. SID5474]
MSVEDVDAETRRAWERGERGRARCAEALAAASTDEGADAVRELFAEAIELLTDALGALDGADARWPEFAYVAGIAYAASAAPTGDRRSWDQARICFRRAHRAAPADAHLLRAAAQVAAARIGLDPRGTPWRLLLDPPSAGEIAAALGRLGTEALVQLVPGAAVLSGADGTTRVLDLPELDYGLDLAGGDRENWADMLDALCEWAWAAVMEPVLTALPGSFGRAPSLVLLPAGPFGMVPWHAAWSLVDGRRRHALQNAQISYIGAPRLLCEVAARPTSAPARRYPIEIGRAAGDPIAFVPAGGHDETWRVGAEYLTAGTHTVVSTLWPVDETTTALVLYMAHHYLDRRDLPPAQAVRTAQLWLRDPKRGIPSAMPAELAARARAIMPDDPTGWAGFTHSGW